MNFENSQEIHLKKKINASTQTSSIGEDSEVATIEQPFQIITEEQNPDDLIDYYDRFFLT